MTSDGERSEPSETRTGSDSETRPEEASRNSERRQQGPVSEATRERGDGFDEFDGGADEEDEKRADGGAADDIPLNIAGHEKEKKRREQENGASTNGVNGNGADPNVNGNGTGDVDADEDESVLSEFDVSEPDADDDEVEPVELLVQLAKDGEIDPWDIDVVTVTDKFLDRLDEADLRTGGRALFYASVLLRMKSDAMWVDEDEQEDEWGEEPWEERPPEEGGPVVDPFDELEREIDRRIDRKRARGMPETLDELVRDLREHERDTWWKESRTYDTSESPSGFSRGAQTLDYHTGDDFRMDDEPTADDVTGTAHDEHMEDIINDVYVELQSHYEAGRDEVLFAEVREAGGSTVNTFLGLLFLAHRGQVKLQQDDLFGDLWVQDPSAMPVEEPAAADD